jgi:hypothetical protein
MGASANNIAAYAEGCLYPASNSEVSTVQQTIAAMQQSGMTTAIMSLFHIGRDFDINPKQIPGDIYYNGTLVISQGKYVGYGSNPGDQTSWPALMGTLISDTVQGNTVTTLCASIGGANNVIYDFRCIEKIWLNNNKSFEGTNLQRNFVLLHQLIPQLTIIDMDNEETDMYYDDNNQPLPSEIEAVSRGSFIDFCKMCIAIGFKNITFCPYTDPDFWTYSLSKLNTSNPGAVKWWNLQCYAGGGNNDPGTWAGYITSAIKGFDTTGYILASDWTRYYDTNEQQWDGDFPITKCPATGTNNSVFSLMNSFIDEPSVGGGFLWLVDPILSYVEDNQKYPKDPCYNTAAASITNYVNAVRNGLTGPVTS